MEQSDEDESNLEFCQKISSIANSETHKYVDWVFED